MRRTTIILSNVIAGLIVMCGYLYFQLQEARTERHIIEDECGTWVSWEVYQDVVHRLEVSDDPYIEEYHEYIVTSGEWVSRSDYEDLLHELSVADAVIFYVEDRLDDFSIEDYLNSKERERWAKYH